MVRDVGWVRALWCLHLALSLVPLAWVALMEAYAWHLHATAGYWPRAMIDDPPMDRLSTTLENTTGVMFQFGWAVLLAWALWLGVGWKTYSPRQRWALVAVYGLGVVMAQLFALMSPHGFFPWWID